jgi:hypothetical protein
MPAAKNVHLSQIIEKQVTRFRFGSGAPGTHVTILGMVQAVTDVTKDLWKNRVISWLAQSKSPGNRGAGQTCRPFCTKEFNLSGCPAEAYAIRMAFQLTANFK